MTFLFNTFIIISFIVTAFATIEIPDRTSWSFINLSYYIILALSFSWAFSLVRLWGEKDFEASLFKTHRKAIILVVVLSSLVFLAVRPSLRILADETNTLSVAKSMTFNKQAVNVTEGRWYYEMYWPTNSTIDKRPLLFPFFVSVLDTVLGYRPANAFVLNYFALGISLFLLYLLIRRGISEILAFASIILVISQPYFTLTATSSSFEIFNLLFILSSFIGLRFFLDAPSEKRLTFLCLNLLMLANIRYESFIFLIIIIAGLLFFKKIRIDYIKSPIYALMLFFCLPLIWQRIIYTRLPDVDMPSGLWINAFSIHNVATNLALFFKYTLTLDGHTGFAGALNILGILALCYWVLTFWPNIKKMPQSEIHTLSCCILSLTAFFVLILFYDQARMSQHPLNGRLYMPLLVALSILPAFAVQDFFSQKSTKAGTLVLLGAVMLFIFYNPVAEEGRLDKQLFSIRDFDTVTDFLKRQDDKRALVIYNRPGELVVYNYGAISFGTANNEKDALLTQYRNHLFSKIYAVQDIYYTTQQPYDSDMLDPSFHLKTLEESQSTGEYFMRISEIIS